MRKLGIFYAVLLAVKFILILFFDSFDFLNQDVLKVLVYLFMFGDLIVSFLLIWRLTGTKRKLLIGGGVLFNWLVTFLIFAASILPAKNPYL